MKARLNKRSRLFENQLIDYYYIHLLVLAYFSQNRLTENSTLCYKKRKLFYYSFDKKSDESLIHFHFCLLAGTREGAEK